MTATVTPTLNALLSEWRTARDGFLRTVATANEARRRYGPMSPEFRAADALVDDALAAYDAAHDAYLAAVRAEVAR